MASEKKSKKGAQQAISTTVVLGAELGEIQRCALERGESTSAFIRHLFSSWKDRKGVVAIGDKRYAELEAEAASEDVTVDEFLRRVLDNRKSAA